MKGRRVWISVDGEPRLGTVDTHTYTPNTGTKLLAVELDEPVGEVESVVVAPSVDDVLFEREGEREGEGERDRE